MLHDTKQIADELASRIEGEVRFDDLSRAMYSTDASNYRQIPIGLVVPRSIEDVVATVAVCDRFDVPILCRGGGTSLAGQTTNVAIVIDFSKYLRDVLEIDPERRVAKVQPGCNLDHLRDLAGPHRLTFGPDPATHDHNTLGGMLGNNSCGVHSVMAGRTVDNVEALEVLTPDGLRLTVGPKTEQELSEIIQAGGRRGEIYAGLKAISAKYSDLIRSRYPAIPRRVSGFNLDELLPEKGFNLARALVGTEGTCVVILAAHLRLVPNPPCRALAVLGYPDIYVAADRVPDVMRLSPIGLEGMDDVLIRFMRQKGLHAEDVDMLPEGGGWLIAEFGGDTHQQAAENAQVAVDHLSGQHRDVNAKLVTDPGQQARIWQIRESGLGATANVPGEPMAFPGWEDSAVPPDRLGSYLRDFRRLLERFGYGCSLYGHFGDGCLHVRIDYDLFSKAGIDRYREFLDEAASLVLKYGGSFSGEHGDGQARGRLLEKMYGPELMEAHRAFKRLWDPKGLMNPGKVVKAAPITESLAFGADYKPPQLGTAFAYPDDEGSFAHATLRCVGVGKCRRDGGGVMCPSYMVTREEKDSTRGRARALFELVSGEMGRDSPISQGWRSKAVRESLDLCLSCKGCKRDCPVNVDMATYKAEFMHHYYHGRLRPAAAYSMGLISTWSRLASLAPGLANVLLGSELTTPLLKRLSGVARQRRFPPYARTTFRNAFARRNTHPPANGRTVMLLPDTFNNFFRPQTASAAVRVLEAAGYTVIIPSRTICCARPLFAWGMLDTARRQLGNSIRQLQTDATDDMPIIGLEPACVASFRDEAQLIFPGDDQVRQLGMRVRMLSEFLTETDWRPPQISRPAMVHAHCHHHAVMGFGPEERLLKQTGMDYRLLDSGCCGMAGSFGFEREHYDVSMKAAERVLLPAVRSARNGTMVIADGFSCREQIEQGTDSSTFHIAEVLALALEKPAKANP